MSETPEIYPPAVRRWRDIAAALDPAGLEDLLAEDVVFISPVVHKPQRGKPIATAYLSAAIHVLGAQSFRYVVDGEEIEKLQWPVFTSIGDQFWNERRSRPRGDHGQFDPGERPARRGRRRIGAEIDPHDISPCF